MNRSTFLRRAFGAAIAAPALTAIIAKGAVTNPSSSITTSFPSDPFFFKPTFKKGDRVTYTGKNGVYIKTGMTCAVVGSWLQGSSANDPGTNYKIEEAVKVEWYDETYQLQVTDRVRCSDLKRV